MLQEMYPQRHYSCLSFLFILMISFVSSCLGSYQEYYDPFVRHRYYYRHSHNPRSTYHHNPYFSSNNYNKKQNFESQLIRPETTAVGQILTRTNKASAPAASSNMVINVDDFGAEGDGADDSKAFQRAWEKACSSSKEVVLLVPRNRIYLLKPVTFSGPCKSDLTMKVYGNIKATADLSDYNEDPRHWLQFKNVNNFRVGGGGTIDGNGKIWWRNSCKVNENLPCKDAPAAVTFHECNNVIVDSLTFKNSQKMHLIFQKCINVKASNLRVTAPGNSPNTDGIHVTESQNVKIMNCIIGTGDDCISIVSGSKDVRAMGITCGPGHGISIGSLGAGNSEATVSNVIVDGATLSGTANGVRIKTWQGGSGYAKNIIFQNIVMDSVTNPIIVDQNYCDQDAPCKEQASAVQISNVLYKNIRGTSASEVAIKFDCSKTVTCQGIFLQNVLLESEEDEIAKASCQNVQLLRRGNISPPCS